MADRIEHVFAVVGQVQQETVGIGLGEVLDQARHHEIVVQHRIVVTVVGRHLIVRQASGHTCAVSKCVEAGRVTVLVAHVGAQQVNHDQFSRCAVGEDFRERLQHVAIVLTGVLIAVVVEVDLFVRLLGEGGEHGVALGHGLLVGHPEGFVARLLHHTDQRRRAQVQVRVFFVRKRQHLLQGLDGVRTRGHDVVENRQLIAQCVEVGRGFAVVAIQAHALAVG